MALIDRILNANHQPLDRSVVVEFVAPTK